MGKIKVDTWSWDTAAKRMRNEKRCAAKIQDWGESEPPPIDININVASGNMVTVYPVFSMDVIIDDITDNDKHKLLAWFVRHSKKKFLKSARESGGIYWSNRNYGENLSLDNSDFEDDAGKFKMIIYIENAALGKCRIVEKQKTITVKELVCD